MDRQPGDVLDEGQVVGGGRRGDVVLVPAHRLDGQRHAERGDELGGPGTGADHDGLGRERSTGLEPYAGHAALVETQLGDPVVEHADAGGSGARPDAGQEDGRIQPAVPRRQHGAGEVVDTELGVPGAQHGGFEPLGVDAVRPLSLEVTAQLVDVVRSGDEEVAVRAPIEVAGRLVAGAGPGFPVLDDVERVLRQQDVFGSGEQLPDSAGALARRGLGVGRVGLDQHDAESGVGLGEVQRGRTFRRSRRRSRRRCSRHLLGLGSAVDVDVFGGEGRPTEDLVGDLLGHHHHRCVEVGRDDLRHDRRVDHPQSRHRAEPALLDRRAPPRRFPSVRCRRDGRTCRACSARKPRAQRRSWRPVPG